MTYNQAKLQFMWWITANSNWGIVRIAIQMSFPGGKALFCIHQTNYLIWWRMVNAWSSFLHCEVSQSKVIKKVHNNVEILLETWKTQWPTNEAPQSRLKRWEEQHKVAPMSNKVVSYQSPTLWDTFQKTFLGCWQLGLVWNNDARGYRACSSYALLPNEGAGIRAVCRISWDT